MRDNGGGTTEVIDPFLRRLPLKQLHVEGGIQRISETSMNQVSQFDPKLAASFTDIKNQIEPEGDMYKVNEPQLLEISPEILIQPVFEGSSYILVNGGTASAAIDFATIYSDNKLATIVGEPVGDSPTSAGNVVYFKTPELNIAFQVSSALYTRPDPNRDHAETLEPDIYLPLTVQDIQQKHDPVKEWLEGLE